MTIHEANKMAKKNLPTRRDILKTSAILGTTAAAGIPFFGSQQSKAQVLGPTDYESDWNDLVSSHGDVVRGTVYNGSDIQPTSIVEPQTAPTVEPDCIPDGQGNCYTEVPTPTPTPEPDPEPTPVPNDSPHAQISVLPVAMEGVEISISASGSYDPDGYIRNYQWNLGDGAVKSGENITHTYTSPGNYTIHLEVEDNDYDSDSATADITVGPGYEYQYEFEDGTTNRHRVIVTGSDELEVRANNNRYNYKVTDYDRSDLENVVTLVSDSHDRSAGSGSSSTISIGGQGTVTTIGECDIDEGKTDIRKRVPNWTAPASIANKAFANWNTCGHAEAASKGDIVGASSAMAETYAQFQLTGDNSIEADIKFKGDYLGYLRTLFGSAEMKITAFIRDLTDDETPANRKIDIHETENIHNSVSLFDALDPKEKMINRTFADGNGTDLMAVPRLDPNHVYQVGVRIRTTGTSFQSKPVPGSGTGNFAYLESSNHEHPEGDLSLGTDNWPDNWENNGLVNVSSIEIQWEFEA